MCVHGPSKGPDDVDEARCAYYENPANLEPTGPGRKRKPVEEVDGIPLVRHPEDRPGGLMMTLYDELLEKVNDGKMSVNAARVKAGVRTA